MNIEAIISEAIRSVDHERRPEYPSSDFWAAANEAGREHVHYLHAAALRAQAYEALSYADRNGGKEADIFLAQVAMAEAVGRPTTDSFDLDEYVDLVDHFPMPLVRHDQSALLMNMALSTRLPGESIPSALFRIIRHEESAKLLSDSLRDCWPPGGYQHSALFSSKEVLAIVNDATVVDLAYSQEDYLRVLLNEENLPPDIRKSLWVAHALASKGTGK